MNLRPISGQTQTPVYDAWFTNAALIGWSDGKSAKVCVHNSNSSAKSYKVYVDFETEDLPTYTITCKVVGSGTLTANKTTAYQGQTVTLTPKAGTGYKFSKYTTSPSVTISSNKFTMPAGNITITATFTNQSYALTVVSEDADKGTVTGSGTYAYQSSVAIRAIPKPGYKFTGWTKTAGTIADASAEETTFTIPAGAATVTAHFERAQSVIGYRDGNAFVDCYAKVYKNGAFVDCDAYVYQDGAWHQCSKI